MRHYESRSFSRAVIFAQLPELRSDEHLDKLSDVRLNEIYRTLNSFGEMSPDSESAVRILKFRMKVSTILQQRKRAQTGNEDVIPL